MEEKSILSLQEIADGGAWKNAAMQSVKDYLDHELADLNRFTVIS